ncbi:ABC transporter ATP-binding protein [bacterium]|nr:ABC transporter ATP-binding protein [bacterium]
MSSTIVQLKKITKRYGQKNANDAVSLSLTSGEIYGFLGPNGAGKTTAIRMIMGFAHPTEGSIKLFGKYRPGDEAALARIGFLSADSVFYPQWTAMQHIRFADSLHGGHKRALELANQFGLELNTKFHRLSSGNKQKLGLILALMHDPELLILDEPTRGLDPLLQQELYELLLDFAKKDGTVFMSSHNLSEVEHICDRVGIIRSGKLVANETMQTLRQMHVHSVRVVFAKSIPSELLNLKNATVQSQQDKALTLHVTGDLNPCLQLVSKHKIVDIQIDHVSLEDMFMRYYQ